mmetsp:Transcript_39294/g.63812  ORF Transcript_39294/g.63812 Transcript_39294/m.63812 type:complete len:157 (+) Transcript_39294:3170-3640(+)
MLSLVHASGLLKKVSRNGCLQATIQSRCLLSNSLNAAPSTQQRSCLAKLPKKQVLFCPVSCANTVFGLRIRSLQLSIVVGDVCRCWCRYTRARGRVCVEFGCARKLPRGVACTYSDTGQRYLRASHRPSVLPMNPVGPPRGRSREGRPKAVTLGVL